MLSQNMVIEKQYVLNNMRIFIACKIFYLYVFYIVLKFKEVVTQLKFKNETFILWKYKITNMEHLLKISNTTDTIKYVLLNIACA